MNVVVFDIETVPDIKAGTVLYNLADQSPNDIANAMFALRRAETGNDFLPHYLQQIVSIAIAVRTTDVFKVYSLGNENSTEAEILQLFYHGITRLTPTLVSWNGTHFDCPVLHYRSLYHSVDAARYWETGNNDQSFRWNNYLNRYHDRHIDLMETLASFNSRAYAPLDKIATLLGFPGKMGMQGSEVWSQYQKGELKAIRNYCETDVLNTYLIYCRFQQIRGQLSAAKLAEEYTLIRHSLASQNQPHLHTFLEAWES